MTSLDRLIGARVADVAVTPARVVFRFENDDLLRLEAGSDGWLYTTDYPVIGNPDNAETFARFKAGDPS